MPLLARLSGRGHLQLQDVVLFKSGFEAHVRQQERSVPPVPAWLYTWDPMQDCKVKQVPHPLPLSVVCFLPCIVSTHATFPHQDQSP